MTPLLRLECLLVGLAGIILLVAPWKALDTIEVCEAWTFAFVLSFVGLWIGWLLLRGEVPLRNSLTAWTVLAVVAWSLLQLLPLDAGLLAGVSPKTAELKNLADASALPEPVLSLNPGATRDELAKLLCGVLFFWAIHNGPSGAGQTRRFCLLLTIYGALTAYVMLVQQLIGNRALFWLPANADLSQFGLGAFFHNRNRFAGMEAVCIGAAFGLILEAASFDPHAPVARKPFGERPLHRDWLILLVPAVGGMGAAILLSLSRGGTLTLVTVLAVAAAGLIRHPGTRKYVGFPLAAALGAALLVGWYGWSAVEARLATLSDKSALDESRLHIWRDTVAMGSDFPLAGTGLGTYRTVFPAWCRRTGDVVFTHAENEYLHVFAELGWPGVVLVAVLLFQVGRSAIACARKVFRGHFVFAGPALASVAALTACVADFGFHGSATAFLFILVIALCLQHDGSVETELPGGRAPVALFFTVAVALGAWILVRSEAGARASRFAAAADAARHPAVLATNLQAAADLRGDDPVDLTRLGERRLAEAADEVAPHIASPAGTAYRAAESALTRAVAACPVYGLAHLRLASLHALVNDPRCIAGFRTAVRLMPAEPEPRFALGRRLLTGSDADLDAALALHAEAAELSAAYTDRLVEIVPVVVARRRAVTDWAAVIRTSAARKAVAARLRELGLTAEAETLD